MGLGGCAAELNVSGFHFWNQTRSPCERQKEINTEKMKVQVKVKGKL